MKNKKQRQGTFMRANKHLLNELYKCREYKYESYANIVKRLIDKERGRK